VNLKPPVGLGAAGRALWKGVLVEVPEHLLLDSHEIELLMHACRVSDRIVELDKLLDTDGLMTCGSTGQSVLHPAVAEQRSQRLLLSRLLSGIAVAAGDEDAKPETPTQARARAAAQARWARRDVRELRAAQSRRGG
jgi:hypothetical protein